MDTIIKIKSKNMKVLYKHEEYFSYLKANKTYCPICENAIQYSGNDDIITAECSNCGAEFKSPECNDNFKIYATVTKEGHDPEEDTRYVDGTFSPALDVFAQCPYCMEWTEMFPCIVEATGIQKCTCKCGTVITQIADPYIGENK